VSVKAFFFAEAKVTGAFSTIVIDNGEKDQENYLITDAGPDSYEQSGSKVEETGGRPVFHCLNTTVKLSIKCSRRNKKIRRGNTNRQGVTCRFYYAGK